MNSVDQIFGQLTTDVRKSHVLANIENERKIFIVVQPRVIGKDLHPLRAFIDFYEQVQNKRLDTK